MSADPPVTTLRTREPEFTPKIEEPETTLFVDKKEYTRVWLTVFD